MRFLSRFAYVQSLEKENKELKERNAALDNRIDRLMDMVGPKWTERTAGDIVEAKKKHEITTTATGARCSCGQLFTGGDPGTLQEAVSGHVTSQIRSALHVSRKSWPEIRKKAEETVLKEEPA